LPREITALPGEVGLPILGHTLAWLNDPIGLPTRLRAQHGDVFVHHLLFARPVVFAHPDAIGQIFADEGAALSTAAGWRPFFGRVLPGGLLLRDHEDHRHHRGLMQAAFSQAALRAHVQVMNARIEPALEAWSEGGSGPQTRLAVPSFRQLTLDLAGALFLGAELGADLPRLTQSFERVAEGVAGVVPWNLPGTALWRGLRARASLVAYLRALIPSRRAAPTPDLFGQLCQAVNESGERYSDEELVNHVLFMWMAAHDTTTGSLVMMAYELARDAEWQERLRAEANTLGPNLPYERLGEARETEQVVNEVLRLYPPVGSVPRVTNRETSLGGVRLPPNTPIRASILLAQRHPAFWSDPARFDPDRFSEPRAEHRRHRHSFRPFGGGAHTCMGLRFATLQMKAVILPLLRRFRLNLPPGYVLRIKPTPSFRPADDLPLLLTPLNAG
jgi:cytochrome P450